MRNCKTLVCRYCGQAHKHADCAKNSQRTYCVKCKSKFHNQEGHYRFSPDNQKPRRSDINMIKATSFLEGAVSTGMDCTGENFITTKLLINTGALIPSSVAISEQFFIDSLGGNVGQLVPSNFKLSKRASSNLTMETIGQLEVRIRFNNRSTIFSGSAVILRDLSLPVIIGINF